MIFQQPNMLALLLLSLLSVTNTIQNRGLSRLDQTQVWYNWKTSLRNEAPGLSCKVFNSATLDCFSRDLTALPRLPEGSYREINLFSNRITIISNDSFAHQPELEVLDLGKNHIEIIEELAFNNLVNLKELWLDNNLIQSLPRNVFRHVSKLETLDLSDNPFHVVPQDALSLLPEYMRTLAYSQKIGGEGVFALDSIASPLYNLTTLVLNPYWDLDSDHPTLETVQLSDRSFINMPYLNYLKIENSIHAALTTFKPLSVLKHLSMSCFHFNILLWVPSNLLSLASVCVPEMSTSTGIDNLKIASKESLTHFQRLHSLQFLGLGHAITSVQDSAFSWAPNLTDLYLATNFIKYISPGAFSGLVKLLFLDLSHNQLTSLPAHAFQVFKSSSALVEINLSHNRIQSIEGNYSNPFGTSTNLESVVLDSNEITPQFFDTQYNIPNMRHLSIGDNPISDMTPFRVAFPNLQQFSANGSFVVIPRGLPTSLQKLSIHIQRESSEILWEESEIFFTDFQLWFPSIRSIVISGDGSCYFRHHGFLGNLPFLELLHLSHICLTSEELQKRFIGPFFQLKVLNLAKNALTFLPSDIFAKCQNIQYLDLSDNTISVIDISIINPLNKLKYLNFGNNKLHDINILIKLIPTLEHLDLSKNSITQVPNDLFKNSSKLQTLDLSGNPFDCTCTGGISYFKTWFQNDKMTHMLFSENLNYLCLTPTSLSSVVITKANPYCPSRLPTILCSSLAVIAVLGLLSFVSIKWYWQIRHILYHLSHGREHPDYIDGDQVVFMDELDGDVADEHLHHDEEVPSHFDAYVAYHKDNENWVFDEMMKNIEGKYLPPKNEEDEEEEEGKEIENDKVKPHERLKLFIPQRDLRGLKLRATTEAIEESDATILVLSPAFMEDPWCKQEMDIAQAMLTEKHRDVIILILLETVPYDKMTYELRKMLRYKRYLDWTNDPDGQKLFWARLRGKIRKRARVNRQQNNDWNRID